MDHTEAAKRQAAEHLKEAANLCIQAMRDILLPNDGKTEVLVKGALEAADARIQWAINVLGKGA